MEKEEWRDIENFTSHQVSNLGRIKRKSRISINRNRIHSLKEKILITSKSYHGYFKVSLMCDGRQEFIRVHRLVAKAFIINPDGKATVNHKNGIKSDNRVENLEWCTQSENLKHAWRTGLIRKKKYGGC